ncbi:hypothetical protein LUZ60_014089 [Juncus effusus]|nr:hypothetical protein LUZ60_014089 [Juncus effusus]
MNLPTNPKTDSLCSLSLSLSLSHKHTHTHMSSNRRRRARSTTTPARVHTNGVQPPKLKPIILLSFPNLTNSSQFPKFKTKLTSMVNIAKQIINRLFCRRHTKSNVVRSGKNKPEPKPKLAKTKTRPDLNHDENSTRTIRIATFNAALFSMASVLPTVPAPRTVVDADRQAVDVWCKSLNDRQPKKSILKNQSFSKSSNKLRVSINLPENEISIERERQFSGPLMSGANGDLKGKGISQGGSRCNSMRSERSILEVLREVDADVIALQNVKCEEENAMKPLSELAERLGMRYVFADSWAPEYGNAVLSRWPIRRWNVQRICDDTDFRNVIKVSIDVPKLGEINLHCTHLDLLDEKWRMKQINSILQSSDDNKPHILTGGLNSLDQTDYSTDRWADIVKYYEEIGKPTPKVDVMKFLKQKQYVDAKDFSGECEAVVVVAKGQDVQGTCKYGTRVDYILASPNSPYKFVPGSYGVVSSKGTSDHHIVKVDLMIAKNDNNEAARGEAIQKVVKINKASSKGIWRA